MNQSKVVVLAVIAVLLAILAYSSTFVVRQAESAIVLRFGNPQVVIDEPGRGQACTISWSYPEPIRERLLKPAQYTRVLLEISAFDTDVLYYVSAATGGGATSASSMSPAPSANRNSARSSRSLVAVSTISSKVR